MRFDEAIKAIHENKVVKRETWQNMTLALMYFNMKPMPLNFFACKTEAGLYIWHPTQADLLATDWSIVGENTHGESESNGPIHSEDGVSETSGCCDEGASAPVQSA